MIHKNWQELIKPTQLDVKPGNDPARQATVVAEPLERGFGLTLGNALRRVLLSSLQGAAITSVHIDNVLHEFSSVAGVREDVTDIVLNLKGVSIRMDVDGPKRVSISVKGPSVVTAGDIAETAGIEILNKDHVICHLDDGADLYVELTVNTGKGYVAADKNRPIRFTKPSNRYRRRSRVFLERVTAHVANSYLTWFQPYRLPAGFSCLV